MSSQGGEVVSNMVATYTAAKAVGITGVDAYMFLCKFSSTKKTISHSNSF